MSTLKNSFSPVAIRRHVYELVMLIGILVLFAVSYNFWQNVTANKVLEKANDYHLGSNVNFLKATDALHVINSVLTLVKIKREGFDEQKQSEFSILLFQVQQGLDSALVLQQEFSDKRFSLLSDRLHFQYNDFTQVIADFRRFDFTVEANNAEARNTEVKRLIVTLKQLVRLHTVVREELLVKLKVQKDRQAIVYIVMLFLFALISIFIMRRGLLSIDGIILRHRNAEQALLEAQQHAQQILASQNETLEQTVVERTQDLLDAQEQLLRKSRLETLGQITGIVSHELRNPLGTISASMYTLRKKIQQIPDMGRILDRIERSVVRCDHIVEELLVYSRNRALNLSLIDFDDWLRKIVDEHTVPMDVQLELHGQAQLDIDSEQMRGAFVNLLDNACQAMSEEDGTPKVGSQLCIRTMLQEGKLVCEIEDNGAGMSQEVQEKIFEPLFTTKTYGVGLGMTIVKRTIEQHGGQLDIQSVQNNGTVCRISLELTED